MIREGIATVFVSDMDRAVRFYVEVLGLKLRLRAGNEWAEIEVGRDLVIGLHSAGEGGPPPGTAGSIQIGLEVDEPLEKVVDELRRRGARIEAPIHEDDAVRLAFFGDPDGNSLYLCEVKHTGQQTGE